MLSPQAWQKKAISQTKQISKVSIAFCVSIVLSMHGYTKEVTHRKAESLSLETLIEKIRQYQATQGLWVAQQNIADANIKNSQLWQNPSLNIDRAGFKSDQDEEWVVGISQPLDIFGQRKVTKNVANIAKEQVQLKQKNYDVQLQIIVKHLWSQIILSKVESTLLKEQLAVSQDSLQAAEKRFQAGSIAQVDVDRVRLTHLENVKLLEDVNLRLEIEEQQLANLSGQTASNVILNQDVQSLWPEQTFEIVNQNLQANLQEKLLQVQILEAQANLTLLDAQRRPNPTVNVSIKQTKKPNNDQDQQLTLGVSIPVSIFNRQQHRMEIAKAKVNVLDKQQQFYRKQNQLEVQTKLTELKGLKKQFNLITTQQVPLALNIQQRTLQGFKAGKLNVMDIQQATLQLHGARLQVVQMLKMAWQKSIEVESLSLGIEPSKLMAADALNQLNQDLVQDTNALAIIGVDN